MATAAAAARHSVFGSAGGGLGLRLRIFPRKEDGSVAWIVEQGSIGSPPIAGGCAEAERGALAGGEWRDLLIGLTSARLGSASLCLRLLFGGTELVPEMRLSGFEPRSHWSVALGACGVAPRLRRPVRGTLRI